MSNGFDFLIYKAADEEVSVNAVIKDDTIWLTQKSMSELFEVTPQTITRHLANIYEEKELFKDTTCTKIVQVQNEGSRQVKRNIDFYNLDAIISVGYRVNSKQAKEKAEAEYDIFNRTQHIYSDFDKAVGLIDSRK